MRFSRWCIQIHITCNSRCEWKQVIILNKETFDLKKVPYALAVRPFLTGSLWHLEMSGQISLLLYYHQLLADTSRWYASILIIRPLLSTHTAAPFHCSLWNWRLWVGRVCGLKMWMKMIQNRYVLSAVVAARRKIFRINYLHEKWICSQQDIKITCSLCRSKMKINTLVLYFLNSITVNTVCSYFIGRSCSWTTG